MKLNLPIQDLLKKRKFQLIIVVMIVVAVLPLFIGSDYIISEVLTPIIILAIYASSWNLLASSGQGSLGHAAFLGIGGFTSALFAIKLGLPPVAGLLVGAVFSAAVGFLIGLACVRLKAWFLAMVTFGFSVIIVTLFSYFDSVTGAITGFPTPSLGANGFQFFYVAFAFSVASIAVIFWVMRSKIGLAFKAIHENEAEANMIGINTAKYRLIAFVLSTFFAGLAGGLYAINMRYIDVSIFGSVYSFEPLMMCVIGGLGTMEGPLIGSAIMVSIDAFLPKIDPALQLAMGPLFPAVSFVGPPIRLIGLGLFFVLVVIFLPKGVASLLPKVYNYFTKKPKGDEHK